MEGRRGWDGRLVARVALQRVPAGGESLQGRCAAAYRDVPAGELTGPASAIPPAYKE